MNGKDFTEDQRTFHYYTEPILTDITPTVCAPPFDGMRVRLEGKHF
ncbi:unnamed protein product, partial [Discosporangium mesarthrocarpum]